MIGVSVKFYCCSQTPFFGCALPWTPLGELMMLPKPLSWVGWGHPLPISTASKASSFWCLWCFSSYSKTLGRYVCA